MCKKDPLSRLSAESLISEAVITPSERASAQSNFRSISLRRMRLSHVAEQKDYVVYSGDMGARRRRRKRFAPRNGDVYN
ncbi:hypothetical protein EVAR_81612_1 [Eumeta japonica]|uniref:Uncharacterized protein n=1 Tax=Eumeta variegata TaxID=151549 RepID=A0A4C1WEY5_EUMVA|nr:hypothetical protein EVAR_81612_1 [Eumeta japonica]